MSARARLAARLPMLEARLRGPELEAIAARLGDGPAFVAGALAWLEEGAAEMAALEADEETTTAAFARTSDRGELLAWLGRRGPVSWRDRLGVRRRLGVDVVRERTASAVEAVGIREQLLLALLAGQLPVDAPAPAIVARLLTTARRWQVRKAAAEALVAHVRAGGPPGALQADVQARADAAQEHPWVRDACDAWLVAVDPDAALPRLVEGLRPAPEPRHFLVRRLRAERIAADYPERAPAALEAALADPSEHVAIGIAAALVRLGTPAALERLGVLAASPSARVRAAVAEHLGRAAAALPADTLLALLAGRLGVEPAPAALAALARAVGRVATAHPAVAPALADALDPVIAADVGGESTEAAAAARRLCRRVADGPTAALYEALRGRVGDIPPGASRRYTWGALGLPAAPDEDRVGAVLAELAYTDFGLAADVDSGGLTLWRGDRLRFRGWRFLHELLRPAPNKRQSWSHTVARVVRGRVRAPPGRMAEVTATTTPGERTIIDRDGTWAPALPTVDDVLDLGAGARIYSVYGVTEVVPPPSHPRRWSNRLRLLWAYPRLARLRSAALGAEEPSERASYARALQEELGVTLRFTLDEPAPRRVTELRGAYGLPAALAWLSETRDAVLAPSQASQPALAWFAAGVLGVMLAGAARRRDAIRQARAALPLVVGGWGTRGKSGTERIKAGLFHGLGHPVFVKTTGCEAMFISARPGLPAREIFIFRPHDKSSIWEQSDMVRQAAGMGARVMLWECMALRPSLVELLEQDWMRDDLVTLTNAYPDHEDVQGPAGHDVATVISAFVPRRSVAVTSEREFAPVFRERARERGSEMDVVDPAESELFGQDLLDLFPYQEHPRNIALVARVAERLGLDRMLAVVTMAEHVVPDLGVLRIYPQVRVHGRTLRFINGMSANERTGCVTNWRRTGCDRIDVEAEPDHAIVLVVNNRADRVSRSEVFARILVQDVSADAIVLIGTNLTGLRGYVETALDVFLRDLHVRPEGTTAEQAHARIAGWFARLRIGRPSPDTMLVKARAAFEGLGLSTRDLGPLRDAVTAALAAPSAPERPDAEPLDDRIARLAKDPVLLAAWRAAAGEASPTELPEVATPVLEEEAWLAWVEALAKQQVHARVLHAHDAGGLDDAGFRALFRALFLRSLRPVEDPATSGDRIVAFVSRSVLPGARVTVMGVQNIKGTGLDFAYRWVALGLVHPRLVRARAPAPLGRAEALRELLAFDDYGLVDSGTVSATLATAPPDESDAERALRERVRATVATIHSRRLAGLTQGARRAWWAPLATIVERLIDPVDAIRRYFVAQRTMRELRDHTISLGDAAATMQALYARQKGGWLVKMLGARG